MINIAESLSSIPGFLAKIKSQKLHKSLASNAFEGLHSHKFAETITDK